MAVPQSRFWEPKELDAGCLQQEISSFRLHLAAEGKAAGRSGPIPRRCNGSPPRLLRETGHAGWGEVRRQDVQEWVVWLLGRYSPAYASNQFRALQQFFKWLADEEEIPDPMAGLRPPRVPDQPVPVFAARSSRGWSGPASAGRSSSAATPR